MGNSGRVLCTRERVLKAKKTSLPAILLVAEADPVLGFSSRPETGSDWKRNSRRGGYVTTIACWLVLQHQRR